MHKALIAIALMSVSSLSTLQAREILPPIGDPNFRPYPMAVPEVKDLGGNGTRLASSVTQILRNDIKFTGSFKMLDPRSYLADPKKEGITSAAIKFSNWLNVGAEGLIKVGLLKSGDQITLDGHLFNVATAKELLNKKITGPVKNIRKLTHTLADQFVQHFTGLPSVFNTRIAFTKRIGKEKRICVMDFDGYGEQCVVANGSLNLLPSWDAKGEGIYYSTFIKGGPHIYHRNLKTKKTRIISKYAGLNIGVDASRDGKMIACTLSKDDNSEIYRMAPNGRKLYRLTRNWLIDSSPCFSPDNQRIAFVSERAGNPQIYTVKLDGSGVKRLTFKGNYNQTPDWSPRGDWILFNARDERIVYDVFKVNPDSGEIRRLTQDQGNNEHPSFSPDGNLVVFSSTRTGESKLYIMNADGTNQHLVSRHKGEYSTPDWGPWIESDAEPTK
jgi:TolB protein